MHWTHLRVLGVLPESVSGFTGTPAVQGFPVVRGDHPDDSLLVSGIVAPDASEAVYVIAAVATSTTQAPVPARLSGLDRSERYHVAQVGPAVQGPRVDLGDSWLDGEPLLLPGSVLGSAGIRLPVMAPESARVLRLRAR